MTTKGSEMDAIERARLEGKREALTGYSDYLAVSGNQVAANVVRAYRDQQYPAPQPPLPTEPGSLLRLTADGMEYAVRDDSGWHDTLDGTRHVMSDAAVGRDYWPDAVQVFAKTQDEWDVLIAEAEKRGRGKALTEALAELAVDGLMPGYGTYDRIRALRDGEAS